MTVTSSSLRVALVQLNATVGDIDGNVERILHSIDEAKRRGAQLAVFPELAILGYPPRDMVYRLDILEKQWRGLQRIAEATDDDFAAVVGFVDRSDQPTGRELINAAAFCAGGVVTDIVAKQLLPNYDIFDECRYFDTPPTDGIISWKGTRLGLTICEDAWTNVEVPQMPVYDADPIARRVADGARIIINIAASPFSLDKGEFRRDLLADHCRRHDRPLLFVNQVGANDELIFDGRSLALDRRGEVKGRLAEFGEDFQIIDVEPGGEVSPQQQPIRPVYSSRSEQARRAIGLGIRDYVEKSGFNGAIVGLSGGIDSSVSVALAAEALGPDRVHAVAMPSRFSSSHGREDARILAENLGVEFDEIAIEQSYSAMLDTLQPHFDDDSFGVTEENLQARIRGVLLMALSNKSDGRLVLACGNKSELAVGYSTLYGDMCGALAVIGDAPKNLVYDIARTINDDAGTDVIPQRVLEKAPSAELRPDQKDEDSLPPYDTLDAILQRYLVDHQSVDTIIDAGFDAESVHRVVNMVHRSEYKRWQAPPILRITDKAFGTGWRYPLAALYQR